jgi:hypothetical protein
MAQTVLMATLAQLVHQVMMGLRVQLDLLALME